MNTNPAAPSIESLPRFRGQVLNKIYRVWLFRTFLPVLLAEIIVFSFVLYYLGKAIFFQRIVENAMSIFFQNPPQILSFFLWAFVDAKIATKILVIVVAVAFALVIRQITQGMLRFILVRQNYFAKTGQK